MAGGHGQVDQRQAIEDMRCFAEAGYVAFDCADIYTGVEELIGHFIEKNRQQFSSGALPPVRIHTKYVPDLDILPTLSKTYTQKIIDRSLQRLKLEQLDLVQFHWWDFDVPGYVEAALHLFDLQQAGKIRHIGVTNFDAAHLSQILEAGIPIVSNQVQYSLLDSRPENDLLELAKENRIQLLCYGTVAGGFLTESFLEKNAITAIQENRSRIKYRLIIDEFGGEQLFHELLLVLKEIADLYEAGIADIAIRAILQKPMVAGVIVGARNSSHLPRLQKLDSITLNNQDLKEISEVLSRAQGPTGPVFGLERDRQGIHGKIMKYNLNLEDN